MDHTEFFSSIHRLKNTQEQYENGRLGTIQFVKNNYDAAFEELFQHHENLRNNDFMKLQLELGQVVAVVNDLKCVTAEANKNFDFKSLKERLILFETNVNNLKMMFDEELNNLSKCEIELATELSVIEDKISNFNKNATPVKSVYTLKNIFSDENLCQEVKDFLNFVKKSRGHEGGWTINDHTVFLKVYNKNKNIEKIASLVHIKLPDISKVDIIAHAHWYKEYVELKSRQKEAIQEWRKSKKFGETNQDSAEDITTGDKMKPAQKPDDRETIKAKLEQWKLEKQERLERHRSRLAENSERIKGIKSKENQKKLTTKREVEEWRNAKCLREITERMDRAMAEMREREMRQAAANKLIKVFQSNDDSYVNRRRIRKDMPAANRSRSVPRKAHSARDPCRLFRPTMQWIARITSEDACDEKAVSITNVPKLAVPTWRKNMNQR